MRLAFIVLALAGCATSYQSARTLAPGKTQVTAAISRVDLNNVGDEDIATNAFYVGDLQIRTGLGERADGGIRITRTPGVDETISMAAVEPKVMLTERGAKTAISIAVPIGVVWAEQGTDFEDGTIVITPSLMFGFTMSPDVELVVAPKVFFIKPDGEDSETELGGSIGVRFSDAAGTFAVHPELGILRVSDGGESETFLTFGVGIAAGN